jgi:hypothetical protein
MLDVADLRIEVLSAMHIVPVNLRCGSDYCSDNKEYANLPAAEHDTTTSRVSAPRTDRNENKEEACKTSDMWINIVQLHIIFFLFRRHHDRIAFTTA